MVFMAIMVSIMVVMFFMVSIVDLVLMVVLNIIWPFNDCLMLKTIKMTTYVVYFDQSSGAAHPNAGQNTQHTYHLKFESKVCHTTLNNHSLDTEIPHLMVRNDCKDCLQ